MPSEIEVTVRELFENFVDEILNTEIVWGLSNEDGWAICDSNDFEDREAIPFWSDEKKAQALCSGDWQDYVPRPIPIDEFVDAWLHGMHEDNLLVGTNWDEELVGPEIEPIMMIEDILGEE